MLRENPSKIKNRESRKEKREKVNQLYLAQQNPRGLLLRRAWQLILLTFHQHLPNTFGTLSVAIGGGFDSIFHFKNDTIRGKYAPITNLSVKKKEKILKIFENHAEFIKILQEQEITQFAYRLIRNSIKETIESTKETIDFYSIDEKKKPQPNSLTSRETEYLNQISTSIATFDDDNIYNSQNKHNKSSTIKRKKEEDTRDTSSDNLNPPKEPRTSELGLFSESTQPLVPIKIEPVIVKIVNLENVMDDLREDLKTKLKGKRPGTDCGNLVQYTLSALDALIEGKPCPDTTISTKSTLNSTTSMDKIYQIKVERMDTDEERYTSSFHHPITGLVSRTSAKGLNSSLPAIVENTVDIEDGENQTIVNLNPENVPNTKSSLSTLNHDLMQLAKENSGIITGHLILIAKEKPAINHVLTFCASSKKVFFIDGVFCKVNKIYKEKNIDDPIFTDIMTRINEYSITHKGTILTPKYDDTCFFLVHKQYPNVMESPEPEKLPTSSFSITNLLNS